MVTRVAGAYPEFHEGQGLGWPIVEQLRLPEIDGEHTAFATSLEKSLIIHFAADGDEIHPVSGFFSPGADGRKKPGELMARRDEHGDFAAYGSARSRSFRGPR